VMLAVVVGLMTVASAWLSRRCSRERERTSPSCCQASNRRQPGRMARCMW
jgi:hypothetical protein